jgi:tetratricopeptide (TPR) repeat protein
MRYRLSRLLPAIALTSLFTGCLSDEIKANQRQLDQQQAQLEQLKQQIEALQNQHPTYSTTSPVPGGCDETVMHEASRKGGDRFAANDFGHALGYYQDAVAACAKNGRAQLNLARTYEAMGERSDALTHYKLAAEASGADADADTASQARDALARLQK